MQQNSDKNPSNHSAIVASPTSDQIMSNMVPGRPRRQQQAYRRANTSLTLMSTGGVAQQGPSGGNSAHRSVFTSFHPLTYHFLLTQ